jgi:hypothetical protein
MNPVSSSGSKVALEAIVFPVEPLIAKLEVKRTQVPELVIKLFHIPEFVRLLEFVTRLSDVKVAKLVVKVPELVETFDVILEFALSVATRACNCTDHKQHKY